MGDCGQPGQAVASIPIPGGRSLHSVKNGEKVLIYTLNKTFPIFFTKQSTLLRLFYCAINTLIKIPHYFFTSAYFSIYTFNKKSPLQRGRSPKGEERGLSPKLGGGTSA